jgi:hydroxyacylglutathione hydrolase
MAVMIVERSMHPQFLSNTYLVADGAGGPAFFIDAGGPVQPLIQAAERLNVTPTHVLLTHHHFDHVSEVGALRERWGELAILIDPLEQELLDGFASQTIKAGETLTFGALQVRALHTPGHTAGMLSFLVNEQDAQKDSGQAAVFTGDTLFRRSVGGVRAPGHTTYTDLKSSILDTLMQLAPDTVIYPGHCDLSTVAEEWDKNPFIRVWRGLDPQGDEPCLVSDDRATLILLAEDYDGGNKAWVRWPDGSDDIVPGSKVKREQDSS